MRFITIALLALLFAHAQSLHATSKSGVPSQLLDINAASASTLAEVLPGIGPAKAALIVKWRELNGAFKSIDQLQEVKGIGPKTLEKLKPFIRVGSAAAARQMRLQENKQEEKVRADIRRIVNAATYAATPASIQALPTKAWYRKSMLEILRSH